MIDDRIRTAAKELRAEIDHPVPLFERPNGHRLQVAAVVLAVLVAAIFVIGRGRHTSDSPLATTDGSTLAPAPVPDTDPATTTSFTGTSDFERVTEPELSDWIGKREITLQDANLVLGSTGITSYRLEMTATTFCLLAGASSACSDALDAASSGQSVGFSSGGTGGTDDAGRMFWTKYFLVPADIEQLALFSATGPACEMHRFSLEQFGNAAVWACESTSPLPTILDLAAARDGRTLVANLDRPPGIVRPISDPVTATGYHIGDLPDLADLTVDRDRPPAWQLAVSAVDGKIVGFVKSFELYQPTFDHVTLVYGELGERIGQLGVPWYVNPSCTADAVGTYRIAEGDTPAMVARTFDVTVSRLTEVNATTPHFAEFTVGISINIPGTCGAPLPRVLVANASSVDGAGGALAGDLADDYGLFTAVSAEMRLERSVVYFAPGFAEAASLIAERIHGADVEPMPAELPVHTANVVPTTSVDVLVMLGDDHAAEIVGDASPAATTSSSA